EADVIFTIIEDMKNAQSGSAYKRGKRHLAAAALCGLAVIWGVPLAAHAVGLRSNALFAVIVPLTIIWLLYFGLKSSLISCPQCGRSVFIRGFGWSVPWPAATCSKCGTDLTGG
ncbi:hypothetical protein, partial [Sphingopyxis sp. KK2]|uniref:hypothetical protein n=1 Tax=Sphingopyxis sp. KK2 TaxID=1855727 RepID=UPI001C4E1E8D